MTSKKKTSKTGAERFSAWVASFGDVEYGVMASDTPPVDPAAAQAARLMVGALPTSSAAEHTARLAQELSTLLRADQRSSREEKKGSDGRKQARNGAA